MNIIIVGAGIGGLTLGNLLHQAGQNIHFQIYERDADVHSRTQGYSISLREPGGLSALQRLGLYDDLRKFSPVMQNLSFYTSEGKLLMNLKEDPASPKATLRVPRAKLRDLLLRDIADCVRFNTPCVGYAQQDGELTVRLADGHEKPADLLVACDGVNSGIRQQMLGDAPHYLGISAISGAVTHVIDNPLLANGSVMIIGNGAALFLLKEDDATAWSFSMPVSKGEFENMPKPALRDRVVEATRGWTAPVPDLIQQTDPEGLTVRGYYDRDPLTSARRDHVILMGDAAHPMSPFRGEGANNAMLDALSLADVLTASDGKSLDGKLAQWESEMLKRTRKAVLDSRQAALDLHTKNPVAGAVRNAKYRFFNWLMAYAPKK